MKTVLFEIDLTENQDIFGHYEAGIPYIDLVQVTDEFFNFADFWGESNYNKVKQQVGSVAITESDGSLNNYTEADSLADLRTQNRSFYYSDFTLYLHINEYEPWWIQQQIEIGIVQGYSNNGYHSGTAYYEPRLVTDGLTIQYEKDPLWAGIISTPDRTVDLLNGDGALDNLANSDIYGNATRIKIGDEGEAYADFTTLTESRVNAVPNVQFDRVTVSIQDRRAFLSRRIPTNRYNKTDFPSLRDKDVDKPIPLAFGECRNVPTTPIGSYVFKICDPLTGEYDGIQSIDTVYVDGTAVTPSATSLTDCTVTIASADVDKEYSENVTADIHGYEDGSSVLIDNSLYVLRELMRLYADTEYIASNYDTTQWDSYEATARDITLFIEEEDLKEVIEKIALSEFGIFYVELDGRYSFKKSDNDRGIADIVRQNDIINEPSAEYDPENFLTSVDIRYNEDVKEGEFLRSVYDDLESEIFLKYKQYREKKYETAIATSTGAAAMAVEVMALAKEIPTYFPVAVPLDDYLGLALLDNIHAFINRPLSSWYGRIKTEVLSMALNLGSEQAEYKLRYIADAVEADLVPTFGLYSEWLFDGDATDEEGNADGTLYGYEVEDADSTQSDFSEGTLTDVEADADYLRLAESDALSFDGTDDYVSLPTLSATGDYTVEFWLNPDALTDEEYLVGMGYDNNNSALVYYDGSLRYGEKDTTFSNLDTSIALSTSTWSHIAIKRESGTIYVYINGVQEYSAAAPKNNDIDSNNWHLGYAIPRSKAGVYYNGKMSDFRLWSYARTQTEIQDNMNKRLNGDETGLVAYYKLDEGTGTTATDSAGSNDGTIDGATWTTTDYFYHVEGNRVSPNLSLDDITDVESSSIEWTTTTPTDTSVTIETRISEDGGSTWGAWQTATSGSSVPGISVGDDLTNHLLQVRQNLSTTDITATPQVDTLTVTINDEPYVAGTRGQALDLDGSNDYDDFGDESLTEYTLACSIKTSGSGTIFGGAAAEDNSLSLSGGNLTLSTDGGAGLSLSTTGLSLADGTWHHIAVAISSDAAVIYVDGSAEASGDGESTSRTWRYIGANNEASLFTGAVDEARIYKRALQSNEVNNLYIYTANLYRE